MTLSKRDWLRALNSAATILADLHGSCSWCAETPDQLDCLVCGRVGHDAEALLEHVAAVKAEERRRKAEKARQN